MRFLTMVKAKEPHAPPPPGLMAAIAKLGEQATRSGELVLTGGLLPSAMGARVRLSGGELRVIDGPFTEAKEIVGGFAIYEVDSKEKAIEATLRFMKLHQEHWPGWEGETEIRPMFGGADFAEKK
jgi:hypothetical protein